MFVFVYGTLKRGYGNNHCLDRAYFVDTAVTLKKFRLYNAGFPVMCDDTHTNDACNAYVRGEVWHFNDVEILRRLDRLEGNGRMYHRKRINVELQDGTRMKVQAYIGDRKFWQNKGRDDLLPVEHGCYEWPAKRQTKDVA